MDSQIIFTHLVSIQVSKGGQVVQVLVGNLDRTDHQAQEDLKVLKEKRVHLDQDLKDLQGKR